jgi:hypothetical protein
MVVLSLYSPPLNLLDYSAWGILQTKGNTTSEPNLGYLKQTIQQEFDSKIWQCCGKIAAGSGRAWRRLLSLEVPIAISSQENILTHHLQQFSEL